MEAARFDTLVRWLTRDASRRRVLAGLAAAALNGLRPGRAGAACDPASCDEVDACGSKSCIGVQCVSFPEDAGTVCRPAVNDCDLAEVCNGTSIACPTDRKKANGAVCSSDGNSCTVDVCQNGQCTHPAKADREECDDDGNSCTLDICLGGVCTHEAFVDGALCPDKAGNLCCDGTCVDPQSNKLHCGQCGKRCRTGHCRNGRCTKRKKKR